jgi:DNA polymerase III delta prime subunit
MMSDYTMWIEKHKPSTLEECILDAFPEYVKRQMLHISKQNSIPNVMLYGIAGTGKSTIARILCDNSKYDVHPLNGSMMTKSDIPALEKFVKANNLFGNHRVVFIDEADGISTPAQLALRSLIEPMHNVSWFFTCNFRKKLIEPLTSRFMQIECSQPPQSNREKHIAAITRRCQQILATEKIEIVSADELQQLVSNKYPDIRATINELQMRYSFLAEAA